MDIYETEFALVIEADLPGVHSEHVDIQCDRHTLTISGMRGATLPVKDKAQLARRRERSPFVRWTTHTRSLPDSRKKARRASRMSKGRGGRT